VYPPWVFGLHCAPWNRIFHPVWLAPHGCDDLLEKGAHLSDGPAAKTLGHAAEEKSYTRGDIVGSHDEKAEDRAEISIIYDSLKARRCSLFRGVFTISLALK
jgi:hypothetical protein